MSAAAAPSAGAQGASADRTWFEELFRATSTPIRRYVARRLPADAVDDVVAEVYVTAWRARERIPDPPLPWLYRAAANHVLHDRRALARRDRLRVRLAGTDPASAEARSRGASLPAGADRELAVDEEVGAAVAQLSPADAEVLRLHYWEELSATEIAYVLDINAAAVRVRMHRARRRVAALLTHDRPTHQSPARGPGQPTPQRTVALPTPNRAAGPGPAAGTESVFVTRPASDIAATTALPKESTC